ncbi:recombinase family protein [Bacillus benzoevorans]|uniref:DNA invertase Pin-like site-specific DNA recombinase/FtsZ-binding cell division protein ZapB n=1 Tax=Bacillus benzoevorans TaxID=1456 RepID=A0A7X0HRX8_9BACI|nr:recombinase family protein [Bacillus benzoevorans]MBB6445792.1 DNA invertase Pin-like site-specific DNA recombinase/FtsZ-binding cell division protein ZapB [Bacillus benzoevorans]
MMKRVWCLYRVSSKKQVSAENDIPMQKQVCRAFVKKQMDWEITKELSENGVSGWKLKTKDRDELTTIKEAAIHNEFDILLVYMLDRIGRREDESPYVVNFLNQHNIEVWSTVEGQRKTDTHIDKLLNYISFWQADGESQKTSQRVKDAKRQRSQLGYYQGGVIPTGYKLVETDEAHWKSKDKKMKELVIDEKEADMVKLIFSLYIDKHMGYRKIVDYLNSKGYRNQDGQIFGVSTIQRILANPVYIGRKRYKETDVGKDGGTQPYNEKLRIVSDDLFNQAEKIRITRSEKLKDQDKTGIPLAGKLMFSGLAYCKYCDAKLSGHYLYRKQKYAYRNDYYKNIVYRYRCPLNKGRLHCEHAQNIWGAKKYDAIMINQIKEVISQLDLTSFIDSSINQKEAMIKLKESNIKNLESEIRSHRNHLKKLNAEISKSLMEESDFTPKQLSTAITSIEDKIKHITDTLSTLKSEVEREKEHYSDVNFIANELKNWEIRFDHADENLKKAMLSRIIDRVSLGKNEVDITFNLALEECMQHVKC